MSVIILNTLKIIGLVIAGIIGILLLFLLLVLFFPVQYSVNVEKNTESGMFDYKARVWWLFHVVHLSIYRDEGCKYKFRLFGIPIKKSGGNTEKTERGSEKEEKAHVEKIRETKAEEVKQSIPEKDNVNVKEDIPEPPEDDIGEKEDIKKSGKEDIEAKEDIPEPPEDDIGEKEDPEKFGKDDVGARKDISEPLEDDTGEKEDFKNDPEENGQAAEKKQNIFSKLSEFFKALHDFLKNLRNRQISFMRSIKRTGSDIAFYVNFFTDEDNREKISDILNEVFRLVRHVKPRHLDCYVRIGTNDPGLTGEIIGAMALIYPFFYGGLRAVPDFSGSVFELKFECRGTVIVFTCLWILFNIYFNKDFKGLISSLKRKK